MVLPRVMMAHVGYLEAYGEDKEGRKTMRQYVDEQGVSRWAFAGQWEATLTGACVLDRATVTISSSMLLLGSSRGSHRCG